MWGCERFQGQLAAALYEPLSLQEQAELDAHLEKCAACRAELNALRSLVKAIPVPEVPFEDDLLPTLRAKLTHDKVFVLSYWKIALPLAAAFLVVFSLWKVDQPSIPAEAPPVQVAAMTSPAEAALAHAAELTAKGNYQGAFDLLNEALRAHSGDGQAGALQMALADLEFSRFQHYDRAYEAYANLKTQYWETFRKHPMNGERMNLLDEARQREFEALYAIDRSRDSFEGLEQIVAQYPATYVASLAVDSMKQLVLQTEQEQFETEVAALERVRERCTQAAAVAQVSLALGNRYWKELNDPATARDLFIDVSKTESTALAKAAEQALDELDQAAHQP
ncbi:MAG: zf-HC2 domain-containing protein [Candidatus Hydrogenedentes bacterium]|nr:zf-HC2 domain-containing protein [Candidatus Hydrogenedentota bacterium]MBI3118531.1 zf-HC2 domain-containing protein [Candidatus Hydrogenedentota bacterium]